MSEVVSSTTTASGVESTLALPQLERVQPRTLDAASAMYVACLRQRAPLDRTLSEALRKHGQLREEERGFAVALAQAMLRHRGRLQLAEAALPFAATRHALAAMLLVAHGFDVARLPIDPRVRPAFVAAWQTACAAPIVQQEACDAAVVSHIAEALQHLLGESDVTPFFASCATAPPLHLRTNTLAVTRDTLCAALASEGFWATPLSEVHDAVLVPERGAVFRTDAFRSGYFEMQDAGSQLVAHMCEAKPRQRIIDGCAGAGGKTLALAAAMQNTGTLWALDVHTRRLEDLHKRKNRAGAHNIRTAPADHATLQSIGTVDVVLVDAPCSGSGVFRRNPDTKWQLRMDDVERLIKLQRELLTQYAENVAPGGVLVYATCSVLESENEAQAEWFLQSHPHFRLRRADAILREQPAATLTPLFRPDAPKAAGAYLRLWPHWHGTDGFFAAAFERVT